MPHTKARTFKAWLTPPRCDRLVGLVVKASDPGIDSGLRHGDISGLSHTSDFKPGTPVATPPDTWRVRVSAGTGSPGVSTLWLDGLQLLSRCGSTTTVRQIIP